MSDRLDSHLLSAKRRLLDEDDNKHDKRRHSREHDRNHKHKKSKKAKKSKRRHKSSSSESSDSDSGNEWVEKTPETRSDAPVNKTREDWMGMTGMFKTFSRDDLKNVEREEPKKTLENIYDPSTNVRELNPYWKNSGTGVPEACSSKVKSGFKKPDAEPSRDRYTVRPSNRSWKKVQNVEADSDAAPPRGDTNEDSYLTDEEMNRLGAKIVKAEIMGDLETVAKLNDKLERARAYRKQNPKPVDAKASNLAMLMMTDAKGNTKPLTRTADGYDRKGKRSETHSSGDRVRYFADDDKYSLDQMFQREKMGDTSDNEREFSKIMSRNRNPNDDSDDIFMETITKNVSGEKIDSRNRSRAVAQDGAMRRSMDHCVYCFDSRKMNKKTIVSLGTNSYVALPEKESLVEGHCLISTVHHASCSVTIDEDVWNEITSFRRALVKMFDSRDEDVIFFETAIYLNKFPHMTIECVPMPRKACDSVSIYFKKAILECETEWSNNKKVVDLKNKTVRRGVPAGLPYFWVDFGTEGGFAHVIEDQQNFPRNFAQEIIGGILDLDHGLWKRPRREDFEQINKKVKRFNEIWKRFDPTKN